MESRHLKSAQPVRRTPKPALKQTNRHLKKEKKIKACVRGNRALVVIVLQSRPILRLRSAFKSSVFDASKLVSTKTPLLKHCHHRQGKPAVKCPNQHLTEAPGELSFDKPRLREVLHVLLYWQPLRQAKTRIFENQTHVCWIPLTCYRIGFRPPARNRIRIGKI